MEHRPEERSGTGALGMPATVWALGLVSFFSDVGGEMVFPLLPLLMATMSGGALSVGTVEGVADAVSYLVKPFVGARSDRIRARRRFVLFGYALGGGARPFLAATGRVLTATLVRSGDRLGKGIRDAPRDALIAGSVEKERLGRAFSLNRAFDRAGAVVGPLFALLFLWLGWEVRKILWLTAIPAVATILTIAFFVRDPGAAPVSEPATKPADVAMPPRLKSFLAILFFFALGNSTDALLLVRAKDLGLPATLVVLAYVVFNASKMLTSYAGGALTDRFGAARVVLPGWFVYAAVYAGFAFAPGAWAVWPLFAVYGVYYALAEGAEKKIVTTLAPKDAKGKALGLYGATLGFGTLIASVGTQWLYGHHGPEVAFGVGAALAVVSAGLLALWSSRGD